MSHPRHLLAGLVLLGSVVANVHDEPDGDTGLRMPVGRPEVARLTGSIEKPPTPSPVSSFPAPEDEPPPIRPLAVQPPANAKRERLERLILQFANHEPLDRMMDDLTALYPGLFRWDHVEGEDPSFKKYQIAYSFRKELVTFILDDYEALDQSPSDQRP